MGLLDNGMVNNGGKHRLKEARSLPHTKLTTGTRYRSLNVFNDLYLALVVSCV